MKLPSLIFTSLTGILLSTASSHAALVSCATSSNSTMCSLCDVFVTGNTIVNYFSGILLPIALVSLTLGGILYLMNRVDQAKGIITASVLGIILSLSAFLIVNLTMRALGVPQTSWNSYTCTPQVAAATPKTDGTTFNTTGEGGPKDTVGNPGDITGDPTITPESVICNEGRDTSALPKAFPLSLTLSCTNTQFITSAIWHFPSDSNFASQTLDSRQNLRTNNTDTITFTSASNPDQWDQVTVDVTEMNGGKRTYVYGLGGGGVVVAGNGGKGCSDDGSVPIDAEINVQNSGTRFLTNPSIMNVNKFQYEALGEVHAIKIVIPDNVDPEAQGVLQMDSGGGASIWGGVISRCRGSLGAGGREYVLYSKDYYGPGRGGPANPLELFPSWVLYPKASPSVWTTVLYPKGTTTPDGWVSDGIYYINTYPIHTTDPSGRTVLQARGSSGVTSDNGDSDFD